MIVRQSVTTPFPVVLVDPTGAPVAGAVPSSFQSGTVTIIKADRTMVDLTLTGSNLYEIDSTKARGLYHIIVPGTSLDVIGPVQVALRPAGSASFVSDIVTGDVVQDTAAATSPWDELRADHQTVGTMGDAMRLLNLVLSGHVKIDPTAGTMTVYAENGTTVFQTQNLTKAGGALAGLDALERSTATRP